MNKVLKAVAIGVGVLMGSFLLARVTNVIQIYTIYSGSSSPTINPGDYILTFSLKKPERGSFLAYTVVLPESDKPEMVTHRIVAVPGDKLEIRDGVVFVNDQPAPDSGYAQVVYHIPINEAGMLEGQELVEQSEYLTSPYEDSMYVYVSAATIKALGIHGRRVAVFTGIQDDEIQKVWKKRWTIEDFGPVKLPPQKYFVLGDNRYRSMDSRYLGYVDQKDILGCVLGSY